MERRQVYIEQLEGQLPNGRRHQLVQLLKQCLRNIPRQRPTAQDVLTSLAEMRGSIEGPYGDIARIDAARHVVIMKTLREKDAEVNKKRDELAAKDKDLYELQQELGKEQVINPTEPPLCMLTHTGSASGEGVHMHILTSRHTEGRTLVHRPSPAGLLDRYLHVEPGEFLRIKVWWQLCKMFPPCYMAIGLSLAIRQH